MEGVDGKEVGPNALIRAELTGALTTAILPPLTAIVFRYASKFVCACCEWQKLFPMDLEPALCGCGYCESKKLVPVGPALCGSSDSVPVRNVGYCSSTSTTYVLCALHATLTFRCPHPDGTVRKIIVDGVVHLRSHHAKNCCTLSRTEPENESVAKTDETLLRPLTGSCDP